MLTSSHVTRSNKVAQNSGTVARAAVDQATVVALDKAKVAGQQALLGAKCAAAFVGGFVATFFAKKD